MFLLCRRRLNVDSQRTPGELIMTTHMKAMNKQTAKVVQLVLWWQFNNNKELAVD